MHHFSYDSKQAAFIELIEIAKIASNSALDWLSPVEFESQND